MLKQDNRTAGPAGSSQDKFQKLAALLAEPTAAKEKEDTSAEPDGNERSCTVYVLGNNNRVLANSGHNVSVLRRIGKLLPILFLILFFSRPIQVKL